jgi:hypothetical protein
MNPKLFGAIVVVGAALAGCRTGILAPPDLAIASIRDLGVDTAPADLAKAGVDQGSGDLKTCCTFGPGDPADLSGCIPIQCILI